MDDQTLQALHANYMKMTGGVQQQAPAPQAQTKKRSGALNFLPLATSVIGGVAGSFAAPGVGTVAGGAAGGALGEWLAQKLSGEKSNAGKIGVEGAFGALGGVGKAARAVKGAATAVRSGEGVAQGARILRNGAPVATTVAKEGTEQAAKGGIRGWVGNKLLGAADDTALRAAKVGGQKNAIAGFQSRFGEDLGTYLRKNNLIGKTAQDIENTTVKKLGTQYGDEVAKIGRDITGSDIIAANQKSLTKLLGNTSSAGVKLKDDVAKELQDVLKREGGTITPARLNAIKAEFQANARNAYKLGANAKPGVDAKVAEYLKKTLQSVSGSNKLATTGKEMDKGFKASDMIAKGEQVGRGNLSLSMGDMMVGAPMLALANPAAAVGSVVAKRAINSPKVQSFIANKLASTGEKLVGQSSAKAVAPVAEQTAANTAKGMLKAQAAPRILSAAAANAPQPEDMGADGGAELNANSPFNPSSPNYNPALVDPNAVGDPNDISSIMGGGAAESPYSMEAMQADIMRDPKNADQYAKIFELMNPQAAEKKDLNATQISQANNATSALSDIQTLRDMLTNDSSVLTKAALPGGSIMRGITGTTDFDAARQNIVDVIGKLRSGAALTNEEAKRYLALMPKYGDSSKSAMNKLDRMEVLLGRYADPQAASGQVDISQLMAQ